MKTEHNSNGETIWANDVELLSPEGCLPVIGSCQVSSILSNLDTAIHDEIPQNMELIILPSNDYKLPILDSSMNLQSNYVILKENGIGKNAKEKPRTNLDKCLNLKKRVDNFENILYFVCNLCPFLCTKDSKITEHLENAHKNKPARKLTQLKCPACANTFFHKISLRSHLIHDHGVGNSDLSLIIQAVVYYSNKNKSQEAQTIKNKVPSSKDDGVKHKITSNDDTIADDEYDVGDGDETHASSEFSDEASQESAQAKSVSLPQVDINEKNTKEIFNTLMRQPDPVTRYMESKKMTKCDISICKVRFQDANKLNYHVKSHFDNGFKCLECNENFSYWKTLTGHLWRCHKIDMGLYSCDKCEYKTYSLAKLNNIHKLIHSDVKGFRCEECDKAFKNVKQLRNHKMTHKPKSDKIVHVCDICMKSFSDKRLLKGHMDVVHNKIKPFLCSYCGYKGSTRSSLKMHVRQHTGEKPFACDSCNYTTADHNSLRRHKLRHTGQKPYKCSYCSYACIQSSTYKVHLKTKHPGLEKDLMFACPECQFRSVNKEMYTKHLITVHKLPPQQDLT